MGGEAEPQAQIAASRTPQDRRQRESGGRNHLCARVVHREHREDGVSGAGGALRGGGNKGWRGDVPLPPAVACRRGGGFRVGAVGAGRGGLWGRGAQRASGYGAMGDGGQRGSERGGLRGRRGCGASCPPLAMAVLPPTPGGLPAPPGHQGAPFPPNAIPGAASPMRPQPRAVPSAIPVSPTPSPCPQRHSCVPNAIPVSPTPSPCPHPSSFLWPQLFPTPFPCPHIPCPQTHPCPQRRSRAPHLPVSPHPTPCAMGQG